MKYMILATLLIILIFFLYLSITKKTQNNKEKASPFECGFDSFSQSRNPFSLRFFKISLIFLIFDIEIIVMIPTPLMMNNTLIFMVSFLLIMIIIIMGLIYEWLIGTLNWIK